jgi:hypothetical protein
MIKASPAKEEMLLEILEKFHGYLMKYVTMVIRGTTPPLHSPAGKDSKLMLRTLIPRNTPVTRDSLNAACKMLHLAFKGMTTEDIYDTLAYCFMRAARRYDPHFTDKMKSICEEIHALPTSFRQAQLETRVGFDCTSYLRNLVRKGYLASVTGKKKVMAYRKGANWPPPAKFFQSGPIGFVYVLQMWFRYCLHEFISEQGRVAGIRGRAGPTGYSRVLPQAEGIDRRRQCDAGPDEGEGTTKEGFLPMIVALGVA